MPEEAVGGRSRGLYVETYGCPLNKSDSQIMIELAVSAGYELKSSPEEADFLLLNTCAVRRDSEERAMKRIAELRRLGKKLVVAGCLASARPFTLLSLAPEMTLLSTGSVHRIVEALESPPGTAILEHSSIKRDLLPSYAICPSRDELIAVVPLCEGCLCSCSFCITTVARPNLLSRRPERVVERIAELVERGFYEIQLTGQDLAVYGYDLAGKPLLPSLIEEILCKVGGDYKLRVGMMTPGWFLKIMDELLELYSDPRIYLFFHLPLESGDDRVLRVMKRNYSVDEYVEMVREIRRKFEDAYIATDIIVGHPGEDEEAFENTMRVVRELEFDRVHVAQYTPRPLTLSARLKGVPDHVKKERSRRLSKLCEEVGYKRHARYIGRLVEGVVVERGRGLVARARNYASIVLPSGSASLGEKVKVLIERVTFFDLRGKVIERSPTQKATNT
ncbi:MAG: tRNA (N(6)-L-threonylcarbamoyladenosine(37)-C(2))-methylthiotransferase [Fervidicoccaceae archaeon]